MVRNTETLDRRRVRTRAALLRAGQSLFAQRSVDGVSIDDIVGAADVAKGSFYNHFPDKDALARALGDQARASAEALVAQVGAGVADPAERVARALCAFARQAVEHPEGVRMTMRLFPAATIPDAPMNAGVRADIRAGLAAGRFSGLSLEAAVLSAVGTVQITVARIVDREGLGSVADLAREMAAALLRALNLDPAEARDIADHACAALFNPG
jgi:AcrR family transcriptional regulator